MVNANWPTAVVGEADSASSVSASACHMAGPIGVIPGKLALVYGYENTLYLYHLLFGLNQVPQLLRRIPIEAALDKVLKLPEVE